MRIYFLITTFALILFTSCKTTEYITKVETKTDTLIVKERITDTIIREKTIEITKPIRNNVFLPCPDDKKKPTSGGSSSGNSKSSWEYDEEKGGYNVELYCAEQINVKDSILRTLHKELNIYKTRHRDTREDTLEVRKTGEWWKLAFVVVLVLWILNITPINLIKRFF